MAIIFDNNGNNVKNSSKLFQIPVKEYEQNNFQPAKETSELAEVVRELNEDKLRKDINMSDIDMKARLHRIEVPSLLAVDALVSMNFLPNSCLPFTRQMKRLSVSLNGEGRNDIVKIVAGKRDLEGDASGKNFFQKVGSAISGKR